MTTRASRFLTDPARSRRLCARHELRKEQLRDPRWVHVRDMYIAAVGRCEACLSDQRLQVHHVVPVHEAPDKELVTSNLIALCAQNLCHLRIGHGGAFRYYNPDVREHASALQMKQITLVEAARLAKTARRVNDGDLST